MFREVDFQTLRDIIDSKGTFLLDIYAKWCHPCKLLEKELEQLKDKHSNLQFLRIDYDKNTEVADYFGIGSLPYLLLYRDGELAGKLKGFHRAASIESEISKAGV